ncbi:MAG: hypothetical protein ABWY06_22935 [Pseudomonas sp.]|uniref:hypothetical protein n=1 Tax=Pseudomonas sp. TaxID=306 RepID=UPI003391D4EB
MNGYFIAAAALTVVVGLVHSLLGERLVFRRMRKAGASIPTHGGDILHEAHVRILWASWHMVSLLGWGMAAILTWLALPASSPSASTFITGIIIAALLASALLIFVGTRGKHPGWAGLLGAAVLASLGLYA